MKIAYLIPTIALAACSPLAGRLPAPTPAPTATVTVPASPFDYDPSAPFDARVIAQSAAEGVSIVDLSFAAHAADFSPATGGRTIARLIRPQAGGVSAGVLFLDWPNNATHSQFQTEAEELARRGTTCLLLQGYFPWVAAPSGTASDRLAIVGQVRELRRAVDFLSSRPGVDPGRLGYAGFDYGAMYGGILAGVDGRLKAFVLVAGPPSFADNIEIGFFGIHPEEYLPIVQDLDPVRFVPDADPASLFFQFSDNDNTIRRELAQAYYEAASQPKSIAWYADLHAMNSDAVRQARLDWLAAQLGIK